MSNRYRLAVIGLVHDHVWNELDKWRDTGRVDLVGICESDPELREQARSRWGVTEFYSKPDEMLGSCRADVVQICTSNAAGLAAVEAASEHKAQIVIEKPLAATFAQAEAMLAATRRAQVRMFVNWPFRWRAPTAQAWHEIRSGRIGHVFNARIRMAHKGPREFGCSDQFCHWLYDAAQNGAGALVDYCCYGVVAARYLFGMPQSVQAFAGRLTKLDIPVDDNAALTMIYVDRYVTAEASWSQIPSYHDSVYYGTTGTLWTDHGKLFVATDENQHEALEVAPLPEGARSGPECFLDCLENEREFPDVCRATLCCDAQEILEAGLRSNESGRRIGLPLRIDD